MRRQWILLFSQVTQIPKLTPENWHFNCFKFTSLWHIHTFCMQYKVKLLWTIIAWAIYWVFCRCRPPDITLHVLAGYINLSVWWVPVSQFYSCLCVARLSSFMIYLYQFKVISFLTSICNRHLAQTIASFFTLYPSFYPFFLTSPFSAVKVKSNWILAP